MKLLALDTSAGPASCAVAEDGRLLASCAVNVSLTHSQTLLPMVEDLLKNASLSLQDIDMLAVSVGPGSFTGVRIGVAAVKGLAFPRNLPCLAVSTLAAISRNFEGLSGPASVCAVMDARCRQVYTARFSLGEDGSLRRDTPDEALTLDDLAAALACIKKPIFLVGDGANLCYTALQESIPGLRLAPEHLRYQQAAGVAVEAFHLAAKGHAVSPAELQPVYLRLPQAERERLAALSPAGPSGKIHQ